MYTKKKKKKKKKKSLLNAACNRPVTSTMEVVGLGLTRFEGFQRQKEAFQGALTTFMIL